MSFRFSVYLLASILLLFFFYEAGAAIPFIQSKTQFYWRDGNWKPNDRKRYYYDSLSREKHVFYDFFENGIWNERSLEDYYYYPDGKACRLDKYKIDNNVKNRKNRVVYEYYDCGVTKSEIYYSAVSSGWAETFKWEYTIDDNCCKSFEYYYQKEDTLWKPIIKNINNYSRKNVLDNYISQIKDEFGYWTNSEKKNYVYDSLGRIALSYWQVWKDDAWNDDELREYSYNENGLLDSIVYSKYRDSAWTWNYRNIILYNEFRQIKDKLTDKYVDGKWLQDTKIINDFSRDTLLCETHYYFADGEWVKSTKYYYEFGDPPIADIPQKDNMEFHVFPVPASDFINIQVRTDDSVTGIIKIIDIDGRMRIIQKSFSSGCGMHIEKIDISSMPAGVYQLIYQCGNKKYRRMFIKI